MTTMAARRTWGCSVVSGCSTLENVATADTARVSALAYGVDSITR
jgi:hypothetical protein